MTKTKQAGRSKPRVSASSNRPVNTPKDESSAAFPQLRLRSISIRNYKGLEALDLEIPRPRSPRDPDILVVGSKNGAGKTSLLEACALVMLAPHSADSFAIQESFGQYMVRAGESKATIDSTVEWDEQTYEIRVSLNAGPHPFIIFTRPHALTPDYPPKGFHFTHETHSHQLGEILGFSSEPLLAPNVHYWHSYRRVSPGNLDLRAVMTDLPQRNSFKREVVLALMSKAGLFEGIAVQDAERALEKVNELAQRFAHGTIEKLRTSAGNAMDVRISPADGGPSYSFDGLSSGQKEMISTLFLLWRQTQSQPGLVLIDEPELHLNAEWHADFVGSLVDIAPQNQYILATHSEDVAAAVSADRRVIIESARG